MPAKVSVRDVPREWLAEFSATGYLYAIVDATDVRSVPPKIDTLGPERALSLFHGTPREAQWAIAPFLVRCDEAFLQWLWVEFADKPWGVLVISDQPPVSVFQHLQAQLTVQLADGQFWLYRYYDPTVLERHLTRGQIGTLFGVVQSYLLPSSENAGMKAFFLSSIQH